MKDTPNDPHGNETEEVGPLEGLEAVMILTESTPTDEKKWLRNNIFRTTSIVNGQASMVVIDGDSCKNITYQALVDCLQPKVQQHHHPYFAQWLMTNDKVQVRHACQVTITIAMDYKDAVWSDVLPMDSGDILLGQLWMYDKNRTHGMHNNTYTFAQNGKHVTLHHMKPAPTKKWSRARFTKEALRIHNVYRSNAKQYQVQGRTPFQPRGNAAAALPCRWNKTCDPHVGPKEV